MNTKRVQAAEGVILAAQKTKQTAAGIAIALESACLLQSPESAAEQVELRDTLAKRTELLRDVQAIARRRFAEATGRKAYGDRLKAENAEMQAELHETRKEVRVIRSWVSENTPFSGAVPGQVLRTLAWLHGSYHSYRSQVEKQYAKDQETLAQLRKLEERIAELEAERHTTNEALSDAAEQLRVQRDRIAELETERRKYVGVEPTVAEEMAYMNRCLNAVYAVCEAAEKQATRWEQPLPVPEWVALVRNAADGLPLAARALPPAPHRPTAGELAEQRHLVDPLDHALEALAPLSVKGAFALANEHIRGGCDHCRPSMRLPEMCPEGQRLSLAACHSIKTTDAGSAL